eukprot:symbB.v1.2.017007.t1/scaffold1315.1/size126884/1
MTFDQSAAEQLAAEAAHAMQQVAMQFTKSLQDLVDQAATEAARERQRLQEESTALAREKQRLEEEKELCVYLSRSGHSSHNQFQIETRTDASQDGNSTVMYAEDAPREGVPNTEAAEYMQKCNQEAEIEITRRQASAQNTVEEYKRVMDQNLRQCISNKDREIQQLRDEARVVVEVVAVGMVMETE